MTPTLVLLAAGLSTRFGRLKQLEPVGPAGEALLDYTVHDARMAGFHRVVLIVREELEGSFRDHIRGRWPRDLEVVFITRTFVICQGESVMVPWLRILPGILSARRKPWGTAHAILTAADFLPGPFAVVNADDFYGPSAFLQAAALLEGNEAAEPDGRPVFGLVVYRLEGTMSHQGKGGVTRGICRIDGRGWLEDVAEVGHPSPRRRLRGENRGWRGVILRGGTPFPPISGSSSQLSFHFLKRVSAGSWGGAVGGRVRRRGRAGKRVGGPRPEPEFLVPTEVNGMLESEEARVRTVTAREEFFGITHPEDRDRVVGRLAEMAEEGLYRDPLGREGRVSPVARGQEDKRARGREERTEGVRSVMARGWAPGRGTRQGVIPCN